MADVATEKRARMACRICLRLFDAGVEGCALPLVIGLGPDAMMKSDLLIVALVIQTLQENRYIESSGISNHEVQRRLSRDVQARMGTPTGGRTLAALIRDTLDNEKRGHLADDSVFPNLQGKIEGRVS